jgi:diacylglycerol kinase (ATP)
VSGLRHHTVLVVNGRARAGADAASAARAALAAHGVAVHETRIVGQPADLEDALARILARRPSRLLVGGGDGTVSAVANLLAGTEVALGVLPLGTGNDFARNLRIPRALDAACAVIAAGAERTVTVGMANGRVFLNALSFGLSSRISRRLTPELKRRAGRLAYPLAAAGESIAPEPFRLVIHEPDTGRELDALQVVVGNGRFHGGGTLVAPQATIDDDRLDVYVIAAAAGETSAADRAKNAWVLARVGLLLQRGSHLEHPSVLHLRCREVVIEAAPAQEVNADGELVGTTPVACRAAPGLLRVLAPPVVRGAAPRSPVEHGAAREQTIGDEPSQHV